MTSAARLDYANIGLMLISFGVAMVVPFELFLFSYAVLGPAHYLTEIAWLHERKYFTHGPRDYVVLVLLAAVSALFFLSYSLDLLEPIRPKSPYSYNALVYLAFAGALLMALVKNTFYRFIGAALLLVCVVFTKRYLLFFSFLLPTLVHVYVFTGCFMLYGALRARSRSALLALGVFALVPVAFWLLRVPGAPASGYATSAYATFESVNAALLNGFHLTSSTPAVHNQVYGSTLGLMLMRFVAFAYTYHYLNWFSKTRIIQWHQLPKRLLTGLAVVWLASLALYWFDYQIGLRWLFFLSLAHVFLEFPLNHLTFLNIGKELRARLA